MVFLFFSHDSLKLEYIRQVGRAQIIGEDAASGVGIADVHVPVDETGSHHHVAGINNTVGLDTGQIFGFAYLDDVLALDH